MRSDDEFSDAFDAELGRMSDDEVHQFWCDRDILSKLPELEKEALRDLLGTSDLINEEMLTHVKFLMNSGARYLEKAQSLETVADEPEALALYWARRSAITEGALNSVVSNLQLLFKVFKDDNE